MTLNEDKNLLRPGKYANFRICVWLFFRNTLLKQTDNLSRALQDSKMSATVGSAIAHDVITTLSKDWNNGAYELFWECILKRKEELNVQDPKLLHQKKLPARKLDDGNAETYHFPSTPKDHYRQIYFQALDEVIFNLECPMWS